MKETKRICRDCGCLCTSTDTHVNPGFSDEGYVCPDCIRSGYFRCSHCGEYYSDQYLWASDSDFTVCSHCSSLYERCEDCSEIVFNTNAHYHNGYYYCECCYDDIVRDSLSNLIEDYGYKPVPFFLGESADNLYLGVELEVDNGNPFEPARVISEKFTDVYLKRDGSLETGFEIVSHPATLHYHKYKLNWEYIMNTCSENRMKSHDTSTCGLHCHVSRAFFGGTLDEQDLHIAKLILLINKFWDNYIVPFSRRNIAQLDRWASKPNVNILDTDTEEEIIDKVKDTRYKGRYQGINLENCSTIEFRIFRGTLNLNTFIATLQFVDCICRFAKAMKLSDIYTVNWSDLFSGEERNYPELMEYLKLKHLI